MDSKFYMGGTEKTGEYVVPMVTNLGAVGFRFLGDESYRVRIEPATPEAASTLAAEFSGDGWKQPGEGGQNRFSTVVDSVADLRDVVARALTALASGATDADVNSDAPSWATKLAEAAVPAEVKNRLVALVREAKLPGANGASRWSFLTLKAKASALSA